MLIALAVARPIVEPGPPRAQIAKARSRAARVRAGRARRGAARLVGVWRPIVLACGLGLIAGPWIASYLVMRKAM